VAYTFGQVAFTRHSGSEPVAHLGASPPSLTTIPAQHAVTGDVPDLEVIIPALNEEHRLAATLDALADQLAAMDLRSKVRVIDNGSTDRTAEVVDAFNASQDAIDIAVEGCARQGKGRAVARGMLTSKARWIGFCDADLATPASAIPEAVRWLEEGWPIVIGSRYGPLSRIAVEQPILRRVGGNGFRMFVKALAGDLNLADTQCGFKFFHRKAAHDIFSRASSGGYAFDVEVLIRARDLGYPVKELPVEWTDREGSKFKPAIHGPAVARELLRLHRTRRGSSWRRL
jgi:dolichyl-phosphate beta-glucosyltransferase